VSAEFRLLSRIWIFVLSRRRCNEGSRCVYVAYFILFPFRFRPSFQTLRGSCPRLKALADYDYLTMVSCRSLEVISRSFRLEADQAE
jgi:hypothetical protein